MKLIAKSDIANRVVDVVNSAESWLLVASPYVHFHFWPAFINAVRSARQNNVSVAFYIRPNTSRPLSEVVEQFRDIHVMPYFVDNLHAKIYLNEQLGVVTSFNLYQPTAKRNIEIGFQTENAIEVADIKQYFDDHIVPMRQILVDSYGRELSPQKRFYWELAESIEAKYVGARATPTETYVFLSGIAEHFDIMLSEDCVIYRSGSLMSISFSEPMHSFIPDVETTDKRIYVRFSLKPHSDLLECLARTLQIITDSKIAQIA